MRFVNTWSAVALMFAVAAPAAAQDDFYKGKQIRLITSAGVAGGYASYGRLLLQQMLQKISILSIPSGKLYITLQIGGKH